MSPFTRASRLVSVAATAAVVTTTMLASAPAANATTGSPEKVFIEASSTGNITGNVANAQSSGWWGHEGTGRNEGSYFSMDFGTGSSADIAAALAKIGPDATLSNLNVAFVATSGDGSAEQPTMAANERVGAAFHWFDAQALSGGENGNANLNDSVDTISTDSGWTAWFQQHEPSEGFDSNLHETDTALPACSPAGSGTCGTNGQPFSGSHALGTSILNTWAAGTQVSLVYYVAATDASGNVITDVNTGEPMVKRNTSTGKAETAWMPFTTVAQPTDHSRDPVGSSFPSTYDTIRTSAGYVVAGAVAPTVSLHDSWTGSNGTLTSSVSGPAGAATGTVQFMSRPIDQSGGTWTAYGSAVTLTAGTATLPITGLSGGHSQEFEAVYTPDAAGSANYTTATSGIDQAFAPYASATTVSVGGTLRVGYKQTITATVAATGVTPTGSVTFKDKGVAIATVALTSGKASFAKALTLGSHSIVAYYGGATGAVTIAGSASAAKSVTIAKAVATIYPTLRPINGRITRGVHPKLTVVVKAPGVAVSGTVTLVIAQPNHRTLTVRLGLRSGTAAYVLPAALRGTTKITIKYSGSALINPAAKAIAFTVR